MPSKIPFRTAYSGQIRTTAPNGCRYQNEYAYEIDNYGRKVLTKTGETDLYAKIQESLEETKIENILQRVAIGDTSVLRPDGIYADVSEVPTNLVESMQQIQMLENEWNKLDNETKRKYNFSVEEFVAAAGKEDWLRDMGLLNEKPKDTMPIETPKETKKAEVADNE